MDWEAKARRLEDAVRSSSVYTKVVLEEGPNADSTAACFAELLQEFERYSPREKKFDPDDYDKKLSHLAVAEDSARDLALYGVTPASTFIKLMEALGFAGYWGGSVSHEAAKGSVCRDSGADENRPRWCVTLGCSVGWTCAYSAFCCGMPSRGCDLLQSRIEFGAATVHKMLVEHKAKQLGSAGSEGSSNVGSTLSGPAFGSGVPLDLRVQDARACPVGDAAVVFEITSFGDTQIRAKIWRHLATTAPRGCKVVAYDAMPSDTHLHCGRKTGDTLLGAEKETESGGGRTPAAGQVEESCRTTKGGGGVTSEERGGEAGEQDVNTTANNGCAIKEVGGFPLPLPLPLPLPPPTLVLLSHAFKSLGVERLPTSWAPRQPFFLYELVNPMPMPAPTLTLTRDPVSSSLAAAAGAAAAVAEIPVAESSFPLEGGGEKRAQRNAVSAEYNAAATLAPTPVKVRFAGSSHHAKEEDTTRPSLHQTEGMPEDDAPSPPFSFHAFVPFAESLCKQARVLEVARAHVSARYPPLPPPPPSTPSGSFPVEESSFRTSGSSSNSISNGQVFSIQNRSDTGPDSFLRGFYRENHPKPSATARKAAPPSSAEAAAAEVDRTVSVLEGLLGGSLGSIGDFI